MNNEKKNDLIARLQGMKQEQNETDVLIQFRLPKAFVDKLRPAMKKDGIKPRDLFTAAAEILIRSTSEQTQSSPTNDKAKPVTILRRQGRTINEASQ